MAKGAETSEWLTVPLSLKALKPFFSLLNPNKSSHSCSRIFQYRQPCADPSLGKGALNFPQDSFTSVLHRSALNLVTEAAMMCQLLGTGVQGWLFHDLC